VSSAPGTLYVVVPAGIDDPARPSGGNRYDHQLCTGLARAGWQVREVHVDGSWPRPGAAAVQELAKQVGTVPDDGLLLVDGLVACGAAAQLAEQSTRVRLVVLVHMPLGGIDVPADDERTVLASARAVIATSDWTRSRLLEQYGVDAERIGVARPGAERRELTKATPAGDRLLCIGAVAPHKGQDLLVDALAELRELPWRCTIVGPLDRDPDFVDRLREQIAHAGLGERVILTGPGNATARYADADLLVLPSRLEAYGMVVTEALAAGIPVVASDVGGVAEALGATPLGAPGLLVPAGDPEALRAALGGWLTDGDLRQELRRAAAERRRGLADWAATTHRVAARVARAGTEPDHMLSRGPR
jgi:glycosyltransferase involved in cell wall biosynthesis